MLRDRLLTAAVLVPLFVWAILALPIEGLAILFGVLTIAGGWEWGNLMGIKQRLLKWLYMLLIALLIAACWFGTQQQLDLDWVYYVAAAWWGLALLMVTRYPAMHQWWSGSLLLKGLFGIVILVPTWLALIAMSSKSASGSAVVLLLLVIIWGADSGAYFAGRRFGKRKLAPRVSPGKSWEGVAGALLTVLVIAWLGGSILEIATDSMWKFVLLALVVTMISILGDLTESMFKRQANVKDSGKLLPGHGGVLDRIDSITAAAPTFWLGMMLLGISI